MPRKPQERKCKVCGTSKGHISTRRFCMTCAVERISNNVKQQVEKKGEHYDKYLKGLRRHIEQAEIEHGKEHRTLDNFIPTAVEETKTAIEKRLTKEMIKLDEEPKDNAKT